jgi:acyl carrier protein
MLAPRDIRDRVRAVMINTFRVPGDVSIDDATTSADIEGWDSLSHAILIMGIEEEFRLTLPFDQIYQIDNVGALVRLIQKLDSGSTAAQPGDGV